MIPISRPKYVLLSARWNARCSPPRYCGGRSKSRAPSGAERRASRISSTWVARLLGRQHVVDERVDHRQQPVVDAGRPIARMEEVLDAAVRRGSARSRRACRPGSGDAGSPARVRAASASSLIASPSRPRRSECAPRACARSAPAGSPSSCCRGARAWPGRRAAASRSSRRGRTRRATSRGSAGPRSPRARARRARRSSPARRRRRRRRSSAAKNGTATSRSAPSSDARRYWRRARGAARRRCRRASRRRGCRRSRAKNVNHCGQSPSGFCAAKTPEQDDRAPARTGRAPAGARRGPGRRRAFPSRRPSTARGRAAPGSGSSASCANHGRISCTRPISAAPGGAWTVDGAAQRPPRTRPRGHRRRPAPRPRSLAAASAVSRAGDARSARPWSAR